MLFNSISYYFFLFLYLNLLDAKEEGRGFWEISLIAYFLDEYICAYSGPNVLL